MYTRFLMSNISTEKSYIYLYNLQPLCIQIENVYYIFGKSFEVIFRLLHLNYMVIARIPYSI